MVSRRGHKRREDAGQVEERVMVAVRERCQGGAGGRMVERVEDVLQPGQDEIVGGCQRHYDFRGEPRKGVAQSGGAGVPQPDCVTPVRFKGRPDVPAVRPVGRPRGAFGGFDMDKDADAGRGQGRPIEVDGAVKLGMR
jgi:hypothetical protein